MATSTEEFCLSTIDKIMRACAKQKLSDRKAIETIHELTQLALGIEEQNKVLNDLKYDKNEMMEQLCEIEANIHKTSIILSEKNDRFDKIFKTF